MEPGNIKPEDTKLEDIKSEKLTHSDDIKPRVTNKLFRFSIVLLFYLFHLHFLRQ